MFQGSFLFLAQALPPKQCIFTFSVQNLGKSPHLTVQRALDMEMLMSSFPCRCGQRVKPMQNFEAFKRILDLRLNQDLHLFAFQLAK